MSPTTHTDLTTPEWGSESLGQMVRRRARQLGLPLSSIAERTDITRAYLHRLLAGQTPNPGVRTLQKLAHAVHLPPIAVFRLFAEEAAPSARTARRHESLLDPEDGLIFVGDITVPDHSLMSPGERFVKTWAIQNAGHRPWVGRRLVRLDQEVVVARRAASGVLIPLIQGHMECLDQAIEVPATLPGQVVELSVEMRAPEGSATIASAWRMEDALARPCFDHQCCLYCVITVVAS